MYTTHPTAPTNPGSQPEYHMNQLKGWTMTSDPETFRQGATWYRNARDWAKEKRDEFIEAANERAANTLQDMSFESSAHSKSSTSTNRTTTLESDTSTDELVLNEVMIPQSAKRPKRGEPERDRRRSLWRDRYSR
jgi:hypothetical protein